MMAASPSAADAVSIPAQDKWVSGDGNGGPIGDADRREPANGAPLNSGDSAAQAGSNDDYRSDQTAAATKSGASFREKQVKPNKVYIGGLPEHTRQEDLQSCFGKIGNIVNIELKLGYGFVEFDSIEAAEESVAKYHEGYFMGNKIRVEMSHGGGRTAKYTGDPGACFKCGMLGHWARECPNHSVPGAGPRRTSHYQDPLPRDYPPPPPREYPYRDDYGRYPPTRDPRYGYDYPPPPPRDYRRPVSPPRDYRDYPAVPRPPRDYDDYRMRPPPAPPARPYYPDVSYPRGYDVPPRDADRAGSDRRVVAPPSERYAPYPAPAPAPRPRTPPGPPPARARDDYERAPPRDYPSADYRARATTPPVPPAATATTRYGEYPPRSGASEQPMQRYRRRSQSPPPRSGGSNYRSGTYANDHGSDAAAYPPSSAPYSSSATTYSGNGYAAGSSGAPPRSSGSVRDRDYSSRNGTEPAGYSRRA